MLVGASHLLSRLVHPSYKWINPSYWYSTYNQRYSLLSKWDEPPSNSMFIPIVLDKTHFFTSLWNSWRTRCLQLLDSSKKPLISQAKAPRPDHELQFTFDALATQLRMAQTCWKYDRIMYTILSLHCDVLCIYIINIHIQVQYVMYCYLYTYILIYHDMLYVYIIW